MLRNCRGMSSLVQIDGSLGEGGGQVLRVALSLSTLYGIPIEIENIRAGRPKPGLAAQHLKGMELVKEMCNAQVRGGYVGSTRLEFRPGPLNKNKREFVADTQTAGCICLLAQVALPCALFFPCNDTITLILKGGTNVPMGPHIEYLTEVFKPVLNKFGADFDFIISRRGYYPKGGGEVHLRIKPISSLNAVTLTDLGVPRGITGWSYVAGAVNINEAHKMANDAKTILTNKLARHNIRVPPVTIEAYREDRAMAVGNGSGINIVCNTSTGCVLGGSGLGSGRREETPPGDIAANEILKPLLTGACVDEHIQDQMIILMALAKGTSRIKVGDKKLTCHTETAMQVAEMMLGKRGLSFNLSESAEGGDTSSYVLECQGCGLINDSLKQ
ncbi:RNA 3'-terminal phosphate cyclase [Linepithema humile]|uniref:RNA 3'-terminal phosphate cyclase n=1 Tax=Linepithema humile TaxID=83485 RepID=UPI000623B0C2|nr:PREDICTED: RNA 3'-terminal phosphate cyclase [Linepithema humile]XP_012233176.1 PREDICTED: RNA 3'-terminal phosphate cyclase [Linepithema humile]